MKMLIVSADDQLWETLDTHFEADLSGFSLRRAVDASSAPAAVQCSPPDLVVVDMGLPDNSAFSLLAVLSQEFDDIPVIVLSEVASLLLNIRLENTGSLRVARKPVDPAELAALTGKLIAYTADRANAQGIPLSALLYLIDMEGSDCRLRLTDRVMGADGALDIIGGQIRGAATSDGLVGLEAAVGMVTWEGSEIRLEPVPDHARLGEGGIDLNICETMIEGVRYLERQARELQMRRIERRSETLHAASSIHGRALDMAGGVSSTEILKRLLRIPGVQSALVVARDGFVAESIGPAPGIDIDQIGASIGMMLHGFDGVVSELELDAIRELIMEFGDTTIICWPVGSAMLVLFTTAPERLGLIRVQVHPSLYRLSELF